MAALCGESWKRGRQIVSVTQNTAQSKKRKTAVQPGSRAYGAIVLALAFGLACVVTLTSLTPKRYEVSVGNAAKEAITAPIPAAAKNASRKKSERVDMLKLQVKITTPNLMQCEALHCSTLNA